MIMQVCVCVLKVKFLDPIYCVQGLVTGFCFCFATEIPTFPIVQPLDFNPESVLFHFNVLLLGDLNFKPPNSCYLT